MYVQKNNATLTIEYFYNCDYCWIKTIYIILQKFIARDYTAYLEY